MVVAFAKTFQSIQNQSDSRTENEMESFLRQLGPIFFQINLPSRKNDWDGL